MDNRDGIGGNNPPDAIDDALAPFSDAIEESEHWLDGAAVETEAQMRAVDALLASVKAAEKAVTAADESATKPIYDEWRRAKERFKPTLDDLARIKKGLVAVADNFKRRLVAEKEAAKREAQRKAWAAADEARKAAEAASVSDLQAQRDAAAAQAAFKAAQAAVKAAEADTVRGMRAYSITHVLNARDLAAWIWLNDRAAVDAFAEGYARTHRLELAGIVEQRKEKRTV